MVYDDGSTGVSVTLVVRTATAVPPPAKHHGHLPFTGLDVVSMLLLAAVLLALGTTLALASRRPVAARATRRGPSAR